mmetsp:Transcript_54316/g.137724  ORF Transcript_54316/g.137724 Transcript_54316/m.137724 type:complete len:200 (+) Transcript_54316:78-677(+)|eukprot:CAMPEP_0183603200 /NCGR_PEP_ID=MMETSP0371-20130417/181327_1 /TAXON_ID=268820 /ORGANISM="Peridinium aciculiferum, Strain PAER-2" /LENGTH=199 /DNA_ID=CAMNT_0025815297 /DNA_START=18 /DNA_END=617 /DNA_ORIENTATION=+
MCSDGNSAAALKVAVFAMEMAGLADAEGRAQQWRQARAELEDVDRVVEELQEELCRFQMRRRVLADREASLRTRLEAGDAAGKCAKQRKACIAAAKAKELAASEPRIFSLAEEDDAERSPGSTVDDFEDGGSSTSSMEDWEAGLEALNSVGSRDRAANLRAFMLVASAKQAAPKKVGGMRTPFGTLKRVQCAVAASEAH